MLSQVGLDPTLIGDLNGRIRSVRRDGDVFVARPTSDGSFLLLRQTIAVVTNVQADHLDFEPGAARRLRSVLPAGRDRAAVGTTPPSKRSRLCFPRHHLR